MSESIIENTDTVNRYQRSNVEDIYPLSPLQTGLLFHSLLQPDSGAYVPQLVLTLNGALHEQRLHAAWQTSVKRHSALRTAFYWERRDDPYQVVYRHLEADWVSQDWRGLSVTQQQARLQTLLACNRAERFNLQRPPLMRLFWLQLEERRFHLVWCYHHLILDGWSAASILNEVFRIYAGSDAGLSPITPYAEYIAWLGTRDSQAAMNFWRARLKNPPALPTLPEIPTHSASGTMQAVACEWLIDCADTRRILDFARSRSLTLNTLLQGAFGLLLRRYANDGDIVFGTVVAGRPTELADAARMTGLFVNTLPVILPMNPATRVVDWLQHIQQRAAEASDYDFVSLRELQTACNGGQALFNYLLVVESYPLGLTPGEDPLEPTHEITLESLQFDEFTHYPVTLQVSIGETLNLVMRYDAKRFEKRTIETSLRHLHRLLLGLIDQPQARLANIAMIDAAERETRLSWHDGRVAWPEPQATLADLFEQTAAAQPQHTALVFQEQSLTYQALNTAANRLAHCLAALGLGPERIVAVYLERSFELVIALIAIQKTGAAWLPLDTANPPERLQAMLADAQPQLLLYHNGSGQTVTNLAAWSDSIPHLDLARPLVDQPEHNPVRRHGPAHSAYVIYTSGSTGRPKGVINTQAGIVNRLRWMQQYLQLTGGDRVLQKTPIGFDVSVWEFFWPLCHGATLVLARPQGHLDRDYLARLIESERISLAHFVPAMLTDFLQTPDSASRCATLRDVVCSGEALTMGLQRRFFERLPQARLHNLYGPTEAAVDVTAWQCQRQPTDQTVPIGKSIANTRIHILDSDGFEVPPGAGGRLFIGGIGLARGYLQQPALTAERFVPNPFAAATGFDLLYDTGDRASYKHDGVIDYLGRFDDQIKRRGVRIEPAEIEAVLTALPEIRLAAVKYWPDLPTGEQLAAYLVGNKPDTQLSAATLATRLRTQLPEAMIPSTFVHLDNMPLNTSGKPDRRRLPQPSPQPSQSAPPETDQQRLLAEIWQETLQLSSIPGIDENFFALGGHSLIAIRIVNRIRQQCGIELPLAAIFEHPTIATLALQLNDSPNATKRSNAPEKYKEIRL